MNPCAGKPKKPEMDDDGYPKKDFKTRMMNSRPMLIINMLASLYTVYLGINAYLAIGFTPFRQLAQCSELSTCTSGLMGPTYGRLDLPAGQGAVQNYDMWVKNKPAGDAWMYAFFMGQSSIRACTNDTADEWSKNVMGAVDYKSVADFDKSDKSIFNAYTKCEKKDMVASCNIRCNGSPYTCADNCNDLLNTTAIDGWLWHYGIQAGGRQIGTQYECKGEVIVTPSASPSNTSNISTPSASRRRLLNFDSFTSRRLNSTATAPSPAKNLNGCPEGVHFEKNCGCPAGQVNTKIADGGFASNPNGPGYNKACSFNFTRFIHRTNPASGLCEVSDTARGDDTKKKCAANLCAKRAMFPPNAREIQYDVEPCNGKRVVSVMYTNTIVRFVLIGGTAIKMFSIILLYVVAYSTPKDDNPRDNIKLSLCLATPWSLFYICECRKCCGEKRVKYVEDTKKNGKYRPSVDGFLAFVSFIGSIWLFFGLLLMTLGVMDIMVWVGVALEAKSWLGILYTNAPTKFAAKNKIYICCCPCPWPTYKETYPGSKYGMPKPDINGKFKWEDGYIPPPSPLERVKALCGQGAPAQEKDFSGELAQRNA